MVYKLNLEAQQSLLSKNDGAIHIRIRALQ